MKKAKKRNLYAILLLLIILMVITTPNNLFIFNNTAIIATKESDELMEKIKASTEKYNEEAQDADRKSVV